MLTIFNLPPWLCNKRKYIILSGLIPGPDQPGNDIDTYFRPLVDDLKILWSDGIEVWDEYKREYFNLRALLFVYVSDSPAQRNLSGQSKKMPGGCPHCLDETDCRYLNKSRKVVYMGHRRFLGLKHPFRRMKKQFDGTVEKNGPPHHFWENDVYNQVKDVHVVLGKGKKTCKRKKRNKEDDDDNNDELGT